MTSIERRTLTNHFVSSANDEGFSKHVLRESCFERAGRLMYCTKSDTHKLIKPQGVVSGIKMAESCTTADY